MKVFITGGTGYIGSRLMTQLVERGYDVFALVRSRNSAAIAKSLGANPVYGDINAIESMRADMQDSELVFHTAGWYELGSKNSNKAWQVNVEGTRNVLTLAHELRIPKIIYTSSVVVFGDTHGYMPNESYQPPDGPFLTEYDRTKWVAHYHVATPLIEKGAPITIVMPGVVYGPGDHSLVGDLMEFYVRGLLPIYPGPELTVTFSHVDDCARGHILAAEKGEVGESYLLTGPAYSMGEIVKIWAELCKKKPPLAYIPGRHLKPFAPLMGWINSFIPLPNIFSHDATKILTATYLGSYQKAREELGWEPRPILEGMRETLEFVSQSKDEFKPVRNLITRIQSQPRQQAAAIILGAALGLLIAWMISRKKNSAYCCCCYNH